MTLDISSLDGKNILITGGTGMIGSALVQYLKKHVKCNIVVTSRSKQKVRERLGDGVGVILWDVSRDPMPVISESFDYIIHLASNTHPVAYATDPVGTIVMNVVATRSLLDLSVRQKVKRFVYVSSVEIYGQNRGDVEKFTEDYCGYIDSNTLRAGYPESKRCGEALCQAYIKQYGMDVVIPRIARVYGPTLLRSDTKALSQFLFNAMSGNDIILKSDGMQLFSYLHVEDAVSGILTVMLKGENGAAYNVADDASNIRLRDLAQMIAMQCGRKVVFELPDATEKTGFSPASVAVMNSDKLKSLGWKPVFGLAAGIDDTLTRMKLQNM